MRARQPKQPANDTRIAELTAEVAPRAGFVTRFEVHADFVRRDPEGWRHPAHRTIDPAEELAEFNRHIVGMIEVVAEFRA